MYTTCSNYFTQVSIFHVPHFRECAEFRESSDVVMKWNADVLSLCQSAEHEVIQIMKIIILYYTYWNLMGLVNHNGQRCVPSAGLPLHLSQRLWRQRRHPESCSALVRHKMSCSAGALQCFKMLWDHSTHVLLDLVVLQRDRNSYPLGHVKTVKWKRKTASTQCLGTQFALKSKLWVGKPPQ